MWTFCIVLLFCISFTLIIRSIGSLGDVQDLAHVRKQQACANSSCRQTSSLHTSEELKVCYDDLGCVEISDNFKDFIHRPVNLLPLPRHIINTRFTLHTRVDTKSEILTAENYASIAKTNFDPHKETKLIIHGFIDNGRSTWIQKMVKSLLEHGDYNVIVVNWGCGSLPFYTQAAANTRIVGLEIAHLVNTLVREFHVDPGRVHLIGHSLGAHTAGYAGEKIPGLGRITGLDPAGPFFQGMGTAVRLDPTDAQFVDAIHTDAPNNLMLGFGMKQPVGHVDFYVNGGTSQPDCSPFKLPVTTYIYGFETAGRELFSCDHQRAIDIFTASLTSSCNFVAYECADYGKYLKGNCHSCGEDDAHCALMGMEAEKYPQQNRTGIKMYLSTGNQPTFCKYHYYVNVELAYPKEAEEWVRGTLKISLYGTQSKTENLFLTKGIETFYHGQEKGFLLESPVNVGQVVGVKLHWAFEGFDLDLLELLPMGEAILMPLSRMIRITDSNTFEGSVFFNSYLHVASVEVSQMDYYPEQKRLQNTCTFSNSNHTHVSLEDGGSAYLESNS